MLGNISLEAEVVRNSAQISAEQAKQCNKRVCRCCACCVKHHTNAATTISLAASLCLSQVDNPTLGELISISFLKSNLPGGNELFVQASKWFLQWFNTFEAKLYSILQTFAGTSFSDMVTDHIPKREYLQSGVYDSILQSFQSEALVLIISYSHLGLQRIMFEIRCS